MNLVLQAGLMIADSMKPPVAKKCWQVTARIYIYMQYVLFAYLATPHLESSVHISPLAPFTNMD